MTSSSSRTAFDWDLLRKRTEVSASAGLSESELNAVFAERAVALARGGGAVDDTAQTTLLCFSHGERTFAVELAAVLRVLRPRRLTRIPKAPPHIDRVLHESGRIVAVLDASALLGAPLVPKGDEPIVLLAAEDCWLGVRATRVLGPRPFATERLTPPSGDLDAHVARCVRGIARDLTIILDGTALVRVLRSRKERT
jgi:purine-binding chemotaxis protein CheW